MTKQEFIDEFYSFCEEEQINKNLDKISKLYEKISSPSQKKEITPKGLEILTYISNNPENFFTSKMIGEALSINSKSISGSMRKLVSDGYVDKKGTSPVSYIITEKGSKYILDKNKNL